MRSCHTIRQRLSYVNKSFKNLNMASRATLRVATLMVALLVVSMGVTVSAARMARGLLQVEDCAKSCATYCIPYLIAYPACYAACFATRCGSSG